MHLKFKMLLLISAILGIFAVMSKADSTRIVESEPQIMRVHCTWGALEPESQEMWKIDSLCSGNVRITKVEVCTDYDGKKGAGKNVIFEKRRYNWLRKVLNVEDAQYIPNTESSDEDRGYIITYVILEIVAIPPTTGWIKFAATDDSTEESLEVTVDITAVKTDGRAESFTRLIGQLQGLNPAMEIPPSASDEQFEARVSKDGYELPRVIKFKLIAGDSLKFAVQLKKLPPPPPPKLSRWTVHIGPTFMDRLTQFPMALRQGSAKPDVGVEWWPTGWTSLGFIGEYKINTAFTSGVGDTIATIKLPLVNYKLPIVGFGTIKLFSEGSVSGFGPGTRLVVPIHLMDEVSLRFTAGTEWRWRRKPNKLLPLKIWQEPRPDNTGVDIYWSQDVEVGTRGFENQPNVYVGVGAQIEFTKALNAILRKKGRSQ